MDPLFGCAYGVGASLVLLAANFYVLSPSIWFVLPFVFFAQREISLDPFLDAIGNLGGPQAEKSSRQFTSRQLMLVV